MISLVSFLRFTVIKFRGLVPSSMDLLILSSSFWAGFSYGTLGLFKKCGLWSFKVIEQLLLPFTNNRLTTSLFSTIFCSSTLTLLLSLWEIFLYVDVIASVVNLLYWSVSIWYIFDVLSTKTKRLFIFLKAWRQYPCLMLIFGVLSSFRLYYIQLKEVNILWRPGTEDRILGSWDGGLGPDNPNTLI